MLFEEIVENLTLFLKEKGYKKNKYNWHKQNANLTVVFSIQRSQYGKELWYYNLGIGINDLVNGNISTISKCQVVERLENKIKGVTLTAVELSKMIIYWESEYGDISKLRIKALENRLPKITTRQVISYLTTVKL